jgi:hypothetical protein
MDKRKKMSWCFSEPKKKNTSLDLDEDRRASSAVLSR